MRPQRPTEGSHENLVRKELELVNKAMEGKWEEMRGDLEILFVG